jgi:hypothetical protein
MIRSLSRNTRTGLVVAGSALALAGLVIYLIHGRSQFLEENSETPTVPATIPVSDHSSHPCFEDRAAGSGLDFTYRNGEEAQQFTILESVGGGVGLLDFDGDGRLDIFVAGGGTFTGPNKTDLQGLPCRLYRNLGNWKFADVTAKVGLDRTWVYNHGVAVADYDCDGWPDLLVTGYGKLTLFHNVPVPDGRRFEDVTDSLGLKDNSWSTSAGWADLDGDGFPELYVCHYLDWSFTNNPACPGYAPGMPRDVCPPQRFKPLVHALFKNEKGRAFREIGAEHGFKAAGCGLGVVLADVNGDGRPDIYVANDATNNFLFINRGGKLEEIGWRAGVATDDGGNYNGSMGADVGDYDGSGRASIWVTNFHNELHALYRNLGHAAPNEAFDYQSRAAGIARIGTSRVGFGTAFVDFDNDGWEDLVIANGHVMQKPNYGYTLKQKPVLLRNVAQGTKRVFEDISDRGGVYFRSPVIGRGLAVGDLDNDGWPDLVISHSNSPVALLRNIGQDAAPKTRWVGFKLVGKNHRDIVGSTVTVQTNNRKLTRFVKGGGSYLSASDSRALFGLGEAEQVQKITVRWSWGENESWNGPTAGYWQMQEGNSQLQRVSP